jgi:two-component system, cell cycle response regulator DivK
VIELRKFVKEKPFNYHEAKIMILYIEDNPQNMRLVRKMLKIGRYEMIGAEDGLTGLKMAEEEQPELILLDINLPDIDGTEVMARLRKNPETEHIPVIALTANAMFGDRERFIDAGCDDYVSKPISKNVLLEAVGRYLKMYT